jgi:hypothetical protein
MNTDISLQALVWLGSVFLFFIVVRFLFYVFRVPILEGRWFPRLGMLYWTFPPYRMLPLPKDFYADLLNIQVLGGSPERCYERDVVHRYVGRYELRLKDRNAVSHPGTGTDDIGMRIKVAFFVDTKCIWSAAMSNDPTPYWSSDSNGFILLIYDVPRDLPRRVPVRCRVTVVLQTDRFENQDLPTLVIRKGSDE